MFDAAGLTSAAESIQYGPLISPLFDKTPSEVFGMLCSTRSMLSTGSAHGSATDAALELLEEWEQLLLPMAPLGWDDDDDEDEDEDLLDDEEDLDLGDEEDEEFFDDDDEDLDEDEEDLLDDE